MIRVGFALTVSQSTWHGGVSYFRNLFEALRELPTPRVAPVVIARRDVPASLLESVGAAEVLRSRWVELGSPWWAVRRACQLRLGRDFPFERFLRRHGIALLSHSGNLGRRCPLPTLAWIPDLQERHLPAFFDTREFDLRVRNECEQCRSATRVLVSSEAARRDLETVVADCGRHAPVLRFVASVPPLARLPELAPLQARHGFTGPYFHLPNQFWVHKNHQVVVEALARLAADGRQVLVLATGNTADYRQPQHFARLMERVQAAGMSAWFRPLGMVPHEDLMGLMAHAVAVINPSLFEGWSTTVEEARSMGKRIVLSDIPTHREQAPARGLFFDPADPGALATLLWHAWNETDPDVESRAMRAAENELPARRQRFAIAYEEIALALVRRVHA